MFSLIQNHSAQSQFNFEPWTNPQISVYLVATRADEREIQRA